MTREEWRAGLLRLSLVVGAVLALIGGIALCFGLAGAPAHRALGVACSIVAVPFLLGGIAMHVRGEFASRRTARRLDDAELARSLRRDHDRLALGLLAFGAVLFGAALSLG